MNFLQNHIEALIFCAPAPLKEIDIYNYLTEMFKKKVSIKDISTAIFKIEEKFKQNQFSFELIKSGGGFQFLTKPAYQASISIMLKNQSKRRLSTSSLETLSIIAYKQPVTRLDMEQIRGVNCDYSINRLLEKGLIEIKGKAETIGRPILYGTSSKFMDYFGINNILELPTPQDFAQKENEIGEKNNI